MPSITLKNAVGTPLVLLLSVFALLVGVVGPAGAVTSGDPLATGCANGAQTIWQNTVLGAGTIQVRYSPGCGTNWVKVTGVGGKPSESGIWSARSGWQWSPSYSNSPDAYWTPMVWAPGSECVQFRVKIVKIGGQLYDTGIKQLC